MEMIVAGMWVLIISVVAFLILGIVLYIPYVFIRQRLESKYPSIGKLPDIDSSGLYWLPSEEDLKKNHTKCEACGYKTSDTVCPNCGGTVQQYYGDKKLIDVRKERGLQ